MIDRFIDDLARRVTPAPPRYAAGDVLSRGTFLRRALVTAAAATTGFLTTETVRAATTGCTSLAACLARVGDFYHPRFDKCIAMMGVNTNPYYTSLDCMNEVFTFWHGSQQACFRNCPRPKRRKKRPKKPPGSPRAAKPSSVPPLPPNPYDGAVDQCASCTTVGGMCCYGTDPTKLCACGNPELSCLRYGC